MPTFIFSNVNEDGLVYNQTSDMDVALALLEKFPNDMVCVTVEGGWRIRQGHSTDGFS